jgi:hypothetical protein
MLEGVRETALSTIEKIDEIQDVHREMHGELRSIPPPVAPTQTGSMSCSSSRSA